MKNKLKVLFLMSALIGAGSLFVTTLTNEAEESAAEDSTTVAAATESTEDSAVGEGAHSEKAEKTEKSGNLAGTPAKFTAPKVRECLTGEASIQDAQDLKRELAKKEQELKRREEEIAQKEAAVQEELKSLETVRDEIKGAQSLGSAKNEEKIGKLVETFEGMSPKAAAAIVASVDESLAVEAMSRISSLKLGKILAAMDAAKSAPLAEKLAGVVRAKRGTSSIGDAATAKSVKGGEENANHKQSKLTDAVDSRQPEPALGREPASEKR